MGPGATILLPRKIDELLRKSIIAEIEDVSSEVKGDDFWIQERPFVMWWGFAYQEQQEELSALDQFTGWKPIDSFGAAAMCNSHIDHLLLANLIILLSDKFEGVIRFGATLKGYTYDKEILDSNGVFRHTNEDFITPATMGIWRNHKDFRMVK